MVNPELLAMVASLEIDEKLLHNFQSRMGLLTMTRFLKNGMSDRHNR